MKATEDGQFFTFYHLLVVEKKIVEVVVLLHLFMGKDNGKSLLNVFMSPDNFKLTLFIAIYRQFTLKISVGKSHMNVLVLKVANKFVYF